MPDIGISPLTITGQTEPTLAIYETVTVSNSGDGRLDFSVSAYMDETFTTADGSVEELYAFDKILGIRRGRSAFTPVTVERNNSRELEIMKSDRSEKIDEPVSVLSSYVPPRNPLPVIANVVAYENFDEGLLPSGWSIVDGGNSDDTWMPQSANSCSRSGAYLFNDWFTVDSNCKPVHSDTLDEQLITGYYDLSTYSPVHLAFGHYFEKLLSDSPDSGFVEVRNGATGVWNQVAIYDYDTQSYEDFDITSLTGTGDSVQVRFRYVDHGQWAYYWMIDDFLLYEPDTPWLSIDTYSGFIPSAGAPVDIEVTLDAEDMDPGIYTGKIEIVSNSPGETYFNIPVTFIVGGLGIVAGTVTDANTALPVEGAVVTATLVSATVVTDTTDAGGGYSIVITPGMVNVTVQAPRYATDSQEVTVVEDQTTTHNVALGAPFASIDTSEVVDYVSPGDTAVYTRTLYNTGSAPMTYDITLDLSGGAPLVINTHDNPKYESIANALIPVAGVNTAQYRSSGGPLPVITAFQDSVFALGLGFLNDAILGIEFDGTYFWLTSSFNKLYKLDANGTLMEQFTLPTHQPYYLYWDLAWDGQYLYTASYQGCIIQIDAATGDTTGVRITCPTSSEIGGLAYNNVNDHFYLFAVNDGIYEIDRNGNFHNSFSTSKPITGLAFDNISEGGLYLWAFSQSGYYCREISQFNLNTGTFTGVAWDCALPTGEYDALSAGACFTTEWNPAIGVLFVIGQGFSTGRFIYGYEITSIWLKAQSGGSGVIAPGDSAVIEYQVNFRDPEIVEDSTYEAIAYINYSNPYGMIPAIPFSITASQPEVISTVPAQNELDVAVSTNISATFNVDIDPATVNDSTFLVSGLCTGPHDGVITYDDTLKTVTFNPAVDFAEGELVTVVLTGGIESSGGSAISDYAWSFTVESAFASGNFVLDSNYAVGAAPRSVISADFNGDGYLDLATANTNANNVSVLLNNGDSSFATYVTYEIDRVARAIFAADLDGDGDLDLATAHNDTNSVSVLLNNGDGSFGLYYAYTVASLPQGISAADLNGDGYPDLVTCNYENVVSVLMNNGNGTFAAYVTYATGSRPLSVFSADLDNDGDMDLATGNRYVGDISVLMNNGDGTFGPHTDYLAGAYTYSIFGGDFDGDGYVDLVTPNYDDNDVSVLLNNGDGTFADQSTYDVGSGPFSVFASDLDGDGDLDLATANVDSDDISVLMNNSNGTFAPHTTFAGGDGPNWIFSADLNGDDRLDLVTSTSGPSVVSVLLNLAVPKIVSTVPSQNELNVAVSANISVAFSIDMDAATINDSTFLVSGMCTGLHDGIISYDSLSRTATFNPAADFTGGEIVTVVLTGAIEPISGAPLNKYTWSFTVKSAPAYSIFDAYTTYAASDGAISVFPADFNGDGVLDLASANQYSDSVSVLLNNGDGTFAPDTTYAAGDGPRAVFSADLDGDDDLDLATANYSSNNVSILLNNGDGTFAAQATYAAGNSPYSIFSADFDSDGDFDLAIANFFSNNISVLLNNGDGSFATQTTYAAGDGPQSVFSADLDNDGDLDMMAANWNSDSVSVLLNNGDGAFDTRTIYVAGDHPKSVFSADLDGDTDLDLVAANYVSDNISVLFNNGDGTFAAQISYAVGNGPSSIFSSDIDGDGDIDLMTANAESDSISILFNDGSGTFGSHVIYAVDDEPRSIFSADLDNDGDLDLVTANANDDNISVMLNEGLPSLIAGIVTDDSSQPIESVYVEINTVSISLAGDVENRSGNSAKPFSGDKSEEDLLLEVVDSIYTDENGYYEFTVDAGIYDVSFSHQDYSDTTCAGMVITPGDTMTLDIQLVSSGFEYLPGDVNMSAGTWPPAATGPDVTYLVNYFRGAPTSHSCLMDGFWCSADANGDCNIIGSDVTKLVNVFRGIGSILYCTDYEPLWPTPADLPEEAPEDWPGCETVTSSRVIPSGSVK